MHQTRIAVKLRDVPETLLWPLYTRATEARRADGIIQDPMAIKIVEAIDYPFEKHFGSAEQILALRYRCFDAQIRLFLKQFPDATVVGLGEGLETQFWRVDNGCVRWLAVDLAETIELRRQFLPDSDRHQNFVCSALDPRWMEAVDASKGVLITAQGLLMYFEPQEVRELIAQCAARFPRGWMLFDVIPRWFSANTLKGYQKTRAYRTPKMPWGCDVNDLPEIRSFHPNIVEVEEMPMGRGRGFVYGFKFPLMARLGMLGNKRTSFVRLQFGSTDEGRSSSGNHNVGP
jgi:O-methyltransferase involved in polyketide biosynthesis